MSFVRLTGQEEFKTRVARMIEGRMPQSFLITGSEGIGKHTFARELARTLLCRAPGTTGSCGECDCCRYFDAGTHPDFRQIEAEQGRRNIRIADMRDEVSADISVNPQISSRKVFLINADQLGTDSQNLLLKSLEEPPAGVAFILICSDSSHIIPTIMSRITEFRLRPYSAEEISDIVLNVRADQGISKERAAFVAAFSSGIPGRALALLEDEDFSDRRDHIFEFVMGLPRLSYTDLLVDEYKYWDKNRAMVRDLQMLLQWTLGDIAVLLANMDRKGIRNKDKEAELVSFLRKHPGISLSNIAIADEAVNELSRALNVNTNYEAACCSMFLKIYKEFSGK